MDRIGERIRHKREQQSMQLNDLAKKVGISSSALSQIEKAKSFPTIITLKLIAENLQTTVGELIGENESLTNNPIFRRDEYIHIGKNESDAEMFLISQYDLNKQVDTFLISFPKGANSTDLFRTFSGNMYGFVLTGEIQFEIDNKSYVIQSGDSIYYNTRRNFRFENLNDGISEILCIFPNTKR